MFVRTNSASPFAKTGPQRCVSSPSSNLIATCSNRPRDSGKGLAVRAKLAIGAIAFVTIAGGNIERPETQAFSAQHRTVSHAAVQLVAETTDSAMVIGVADSNLYHLSHSQLTTRLTELKGLGVTDLRVAVPWVYIQPTNGTYDWAKMDTLVQTANSMGFNITGNITGTPMWAGTLIAGAPSPAAYASFAGTVAARYGSQISTYEIWNEPNGVVFYAPINAASYTEMLKGAYTAIKAAQPTATVLAGALGATKTFNGITLNPTEFLKQMYAAGAAGFFDALSYHPYHYSLPFSLGGGVADSPLEQVKQLYAIMAANGDGDLDIWATEYGNATTPGLGVTRDEQADMMRDFLTGWSRLAFAGPAFVFSGRDFSTGIINHELNFGLHTSTGTAKPAAQVLAELIALSAYGALPDYTASEMTYARQMYLQLASVAFGVINQGLILPHAMMSAVYNMMPEPFRKAFDIVAAVVCGVVAGAMTTFAVAAQNVLAAVIDAIPGMTEALNATRDVARQPVLASASAVATEDSVTATETVSAEPDSAPTEVVEVVQAVEVAIEPADVTESEPVTEVPDVTEIAVVEEPEADTPTEEATEVEESDEPTEEITSPRTLSPLTGPRTVKGPKTARSATSARTAAA